MKNKGFTLIELLAVIVILAIIALIATPIILNIIKDSKESSNQRSIELYGHAVENAVARYQLKEGKPATDVSDLTIEYNGSRVECETTVINGDGTVYLAGCTVGGTSVDYTYGTKKVTQIYKPQWYNYNLYEYYKIGDSLPETASESVPSDTLHYLGLDVDSDNKVSVAYACFIRNETEYCLKGADPEAYETNKSILNDAYADVENACSLGEWGYGCRDGSVDAATNSDGIVFSGDDGMYCFVDARLDFACEW